MGFVRISTRGDAATASRSQTGVERLPRLGSRSESCSMDSSRSSDTATTTTRRHLTSIVASTRPGPSGCHKASRSLGDCQMPELPSSSPLCPCICRCDRVRSSASPMQAVKRGAPRPARRASIAKARRLDLFVVCVSCLMNTPVHRSGRPGIFGSTSNRLERHPSTDEATTRPCLLSLVVRDQDYNDPSCTSMACNETTTPSSGSQPTPGRWRGVDDPASAARPCIDEY